jgi:hypothetical protein
MRFRAIGRYSEALSEGDPVALGVTGIILFVALVVGLFTLKVRRDFRREEEEKRRRWGIKDPKAPRK